MQINTNTNSIHTNSYQSEGDVVTSIGTVTPAEAGANSIHTNSYQSEAKKYLFNTYSRYPLTLIKGDGAYVWDNFGKKYLDFLSGVGCTALGHNHPAITKAITEQLQLIIHTSNLYYSPPVVELAKWLVQHGGLDKIFFCNSGTEAIEGAIKLARKFHWRKGNKNKNVILSVAHSFHGRTLGSLAATAKVSLQEGFSPLPEGFRYECWYDIDKFCNAIDETVAAVLLEPIQGEGGIHVASAELLTAVRAKCNATGALLIFDEIQCGIGRTGALFAYQYFGIKPDIVTLAKGIANGLPLGALCAQEHVAAAFSPGDHGSTFGGNPISCNAALANLSTIINENYLEKIKENGKYLKESLKKLQELYPDKIKEVRGTGLMIGVELLVNSGDVLNYCREAGLLANITADNVLRMLPPYVINKSDIDFAVRVIARAVEYVA